jgi:hypothetical protein
MGDDGKPLLCDSLMLSGHAIGMAMRREMTVMVICRKDSGYLNQVLK